MKKGMPISQTAVDSLGWVKKLYMDDEGNITPGLEQEWKTIDEHYNFHTKGILAQELQGRFWIAHGDEKPNVPTQGTVPGFIPLQLFWRMNVNFITWVFAGVISLWKKTPMGRGMAMAEKSLEKANEGFAKAQQFADAAKAAKQKMEGLGGLAKGLESKGMDGLAKGLESKGMDGLAKGLESKGLGGLGGLAKGLGKKPQRGGSLEELSTESQVMGGIIVALLAGGSLKGLIDYTMNQ